MNTIAKIAGSTLFGGALVVGTAGVAFADGGSDSGPGPQQSSTAPAQDQGPAQAGPTQWSDQDGSTQKDSTQGSDQAGQGTSDAPDGNSDADESGTSGSQPATPPSNVPQPNVPQSSAGTVTSRSDSSPTPFGSSPGTTSSSPPAFCADVAALNTWFAQREASVARQITALGQAEGAAAANGNTSTVQAHRARIAQLTAVEAFLRTAGAQLTAACGSG